MRACSLGLVGLGIGLVLGLAMVYRLAHFTFCHTSSPQKPAYTQARILPFAIFHKACLHDKHRNLPETTMASLGPHV